VESEDDLPLLDFLDWMHSQGESDIDHDDTRTVCGKCLQDPGVRHAIEFFASSPRCDFCGTSFRSDKAAPLRDVAAFVMGCLAQDYDRPENVLSHDRESETGYAGTVYDASELIQDYLCCEWDVMEALIGCVTTDRWWCEKDPAVFLPGRRLQISWDSFSRYVKHRSRFMFLREDEQPRDIFDAPDDNYVPAAAMLDVLGDAVTSARLLRKMRAGTRLYRARPVKFGEEWYRTADTLGPPPESDTGPPAGRMNPAGIAVFYGALEQETALKEALKSNGRVAVGVFSPLKDLSVLDLTHVEQLPHRSIFENVTASGRGYKAFLEAFAEDVARVTARDGREHIDYVPAQIVTEYFRRVFVTPEGERLDGIMYPSTRNPGGRNLALFFNRRDISGLYWRGDALRFHPRLAQRFNVQARRGGVIGWTTA
jgi:RES domain-containing protein